MRSTPLALNDWRHVDAATGWLALGDWKSANEEIEHITPEFRAHPDVLAVRWKIFAMGGQWDTAVELAEVLMKALPGDRAKNMYQLAVFACRLDRLKEARHWIGKAIDMGGNAMKLRALEDPQLAKVWQEP